MILIRGTPACENYKHIPFIVQCTCSAEHPRRALPISLSSYRSGSGTQRIPLVGSGINFECENAGLQTRQTRNAMQKSADKLARPPQQNIANKRTHAHSDQQLAIRRCRRKRKLETSTSILGASNPKYGGNQMVGTATGSNVLNTTMGA